MNGLSDVGDWGLLLVGLAVFKGIIGESKGEGLATEGRAGRIAGNALAEVTIAVHIGRGGGDLDTSRGGRSPAELEKLPLRSKFVTPIPRWLGGLDSGP